LSKCDGEFKKAFNEIASNMLCGAYKKLKKRLIPLTMLYKISLGALKRSEYFDGK